MSILDRVTKAVGDAVDRGKKEVDQFMRIQKINGQIGDLEKNIDQSKHQILEIKVKIGDMAIGMLRAGTLTSQEIKEQLDQITGVQEQISSREAEIAQKKAEIERIRAEDKTPKPASSPAEAAPVPPPPPVAPVVPPPPPPSVSGTCPQCGAAASGAFCSKCGSKLP